MSSASTRADRYWSRAGSLFGMPEMARALGQPLEPMLQRYGWPENILADPDTRISYRALCQMFDACATEWRCPDFALRLAGYQNLNILGPIGLVARVSQTIGSALKALVDHVRLHSTGFDTYLEAAPDDRLAAFCFVPRPGSDTGVQMQLLYVAVMRNIHALLVGDPGFRPRRIQLALPDTACEPESVRRHFGCPVDFAAEHTRMLFDRAQLNMPTAVHDAAYAPVIRAYLQDLERQFPNDEVQATRRLISQLIATGRCTRAVVARCLNMHPRTLHRRLAERGVTFADLIEEYRRERSLELVAQGTLPMAQIADALGYASQSVFNQAFRRWNNTPPGQSRRQMAAAPR